MFFLKIYIFKITKKNNYDLWHFNFLNYKSLLLIKILKKLNQIIVVTFQGVDIQVNKDIDYGYRLDKKYDLFLNEIVFKVDRFTCLSNTIKNDLKEIGSEEEKLNLIPNAVDLERFNKQKFDVKNKIKILKLITLTDIHQKKFYLLRFVEKLIDNKINFQWTILGRIRQSLCK